MLSQFLCELGERVAEDGVALHHQVLVTVADLAAEAAPGAAAVLRDKRAPEVARARALAVASAALVRDDRFSRDDDSTPTELLTSLVLATGTTGSARGAHATKSTHTNATDAPDLAC